jgi:putative acetyltransferase
MQIRAAVPADQRAVDDVVVAAFGADGAHVLAMTRALDASGATVADLVADDDGIVGHVRLSRAWVDARARLVDVLMLTPLAVAPGRQGQGIGTRLVEAALAAAEALAAPAVFLEGDWRYYGQRGFEPAVARGFDRPSVRIPEPAFLVAALPALEPWMTGRVVYPQAMWDTDAVGLRDPRLAAVENAARG